MPKLKPATEVVIGNETYQVMVNSSKIEDCDRCDMCNCSCDTGFEDLLAQHGACRCEELIGRRHYFKRVE